MYVHVSLSDDVRRDITVAVEPLHGPMVALGVFIHQIRLLRWKWHRTLKFPVFVYAYLHLDDHDVWLLGISTDERGIVQRLFHCESQRNVKCAHDDLAGCLVEKDHDFFMFQNL